MNKEIKSLLQRRKLLKQQLDVINAHRKSFLEELGEKGTQEYINKILDEINWIRIKIREYNERKRN